MTYGNGKALTQAFDNRLRLQRFDVNQTLGSTNTYYSDGRIGSASDLYDARYDRLYRYDQTGRIADAKSGLEARDESQTTSDRPYRQTYAFNTFDDMTGRTGRVWDQDAGSMSRVFVNHREQFSRYDADGRVTGAYDGDSFPLETYHDAAGRAFKTVDPQPRGVFRDGVTITQDFDADGETIKQKEGTGTGHLTYYLRSSVLGDVVYEVGSVSGIWTKKLGIVYLNGERVGFQETHLYNATAVSWNYHNPVTGSTRGASLGTEPDPLGVNAGTSPPDPGATDTGTSDLIVPRYADALNLAAGCEWSGMPISCDLKPAIDAFDQEYARVKALFANDAKKPRRAKKQKPTLKARRKRSKEEVARLRAIAGTGIYDNESDDPVDASQGDDSRINDDELKVLRRNLTELMKDSRCGSFLNALVGNIAHSKKVGKIEFTKFSGSMVDNFDRIYKEGGIWYRDMNLRGLFNRDTIWLGRNFSAIGGTSTSLYSLPARFYAKGTPFEGFKMSGNLSTTLNLVHELGHAYYPALSNGWIGVDHNEMADAAQLALKQSGTTPDLIPKDGMSGTAYFDSALQLACGRVKL